MPDFQKRNLDCKINAGCDSTSSKADDSTRHPDGWISGVKVVWRFFLYSCDSFG